MIYYKVIKLKLWKGIKKRIGEKFNRGTGGGHSAMEVILRPCEVSPPTTSPPLLGPSTPQEEIFSAAQRI